MPEPVKYKKEFCDLVVELGHQGKTKTQMAAACGVCRMALEKWANDPTKPEFKEAFNFALTLSEGHMEDVGMKGIKGNYLKFNAAAWMFSMKNRFRATYSDTIDTNINVNNATKEMTDEELDKTIELLAARQVVSQGESGAPAQVSV